jgi:PAS domain-containing protein
MMPRVGTVTPASTVTPRLIAIPRSDAAFREHVQLIHATERPATPAALQRRLRRVYPRVIVRERALSEEVPAWYVYRDGSWRPPLSAEWWKEPGMPRMVLSADGWLTDASPTAMGILELEPSDIGTRHFTDFVVPGTLADSVALFDIIGAGAGLDATIQLSSTKGDVLGLDIHATREGDSIVAVIRLAEEIRVGEITSSAPRPSSVVTTPERDVAFRRYVDVALERMPEPTPDGLELRVHRLYPHARVHVDGAAWTVTRDAVGEVGSTPWWREDGVACVRYDAQGLIVEASEAAVGLFGRELAGHHWHEFVTPGSTEQVSLMLEILAAEGAAESRFRMPHADGSLIEFDSYTEVKGDEFTTWFRPVVRA